jgi:hypothetical protein
MNWVSKYKNNVLFCTEIIIISPTYSFYIAVILQFCNFLGLYV